MCTYNGNQYIREQLESILKQTRIPDEIVICDDCSDDDTVDIIKDALRLWAGTWKVIVNDRNLGYKKNFQKAICLCSGDIIFLSDQDDVWCCDKIAEVERVFEKHPSAVLVFHDVTVVDQYLQTLYPSFWGILGFKPAKFSEHDYSQLLEKNVVQGSACAFRKALFDQAIPFSEEAIHDEWLALIAIVSGDVIPLPKHLMKYRQGNNLIGAKYLGFKDKLKKWSVDRGKTIDFHIHELVRRKTVYDAYNRQIDDRQRAFLKIDIGRYSRFLDARVFFIKHNSWLIWKVLPDFFYFYPTVHAVKLFLKDLFAASYYNREMH